MIRSMCFSPSALRRQKGLLGRCSTPEWHACARYEARLSERDIKAGLCVFVSHQRLSVCSLCKHAFALTDKVCTCCSVRVSAPVELCVYVKRVDK